MKTSDAPRSTTRWHAPLAHKMTARDVLTLSAVCATVAITAALLTITLGGA